MHVNTRYINSTSSGPRSVSVCWAKLETVSHTHPFLPPITHALHSQRNIFMNLPRMSFPETARPYPQRPRPDRQYSHWCSNSCQFRWVRRRDKASRGARGYPWGTCTSRCPQWARWSHWRKHPWGWGECLWCRPPMKPTYPNPGESKVKTYQAKSVFHRVCSGKEHGQGHPQARNCQGFDPNQNTAVFKRQHTHTYRVRGWGERARETTAARQIRDRRTNWKADRKEDWWADSGGEKTQQQNIWIYGPVMEPTSLTNL